MNAATRRTAWISRVGEKIYGISAERSIVLALIGFMAVFVPDALTPPQVNLSIFYVPFILLVCWNAGYQWGFSFAFLAFLTQVFVTQGMEHGQFGAGIHGLILTNRLATYTMVVILTVPLRQMHDELRRVANLDSLTGIPNRMMFEKLLERQIVRNRERGERFAVALLDCDRFKEINDTRGHAEGDQLLQVLSRVLDASVPRGDTVARLGGDEFAIILHVDNAGEAELTMRRVLELVVAELRERNWDTTLSVGVGVVEHSAPDAHGLMETCDRLMYSVKARGRNGVAVGIADWLAARSREGAEGVDSGLRLVHDTAKIQPRHVVTSANSTVVKDVCILG